jgi:hypothetical protein
LVAGSGPPSLSFGLPVEAGATILYNHVNRSFLTGWVCLGRGVLVARPLSLPTASRPR